MNVFSGNIFCGPSFGGTAGSANTGDTRGRESLDSGWENRGWQHSCPNVAGS